MVLVWSIDDRQQIVDDFRIEIERIANQRWRGRYSEAWPRVGAAFAAATKIAKRSVVGDFIKDVIFAEKMEGFDVDITAHHAVNFIKKCGASLSYSSAVVVFSTAGRKSSDKSNLKYHIECLAEKYADSLRYRLTILNNQLAPIRNDAKEIIKLKLTKDDSSGYANSSRNY